MTDKPVEAAREDAREKNGEFGFQHRTAAESDTLTLPTPPEEAVYGVYADGELLSKGKKGAGMDEALHRAHVHMNTRRYDRVEPKPVFTIRSEGSATEVAVPYGDQGRIVGWYSSDAITAEEMDARGVSLTQLDSVKVEPYIDLGPYNKGGLPSVEQWAQDGFSYVSSVYAKRDEKTGGRHIDITVYENLIWNAESQCPDDEYDDDSDLDPDDDRPASVQRYEAWLDKYEQFVKDAYEEFFNADIDAPETWETATVTLRKTVPYERFTESLVIEDVYPLLAKHANMTDPGTFGSDYIMNIVRRRVEEYEAELERESEMSSRFEQQILREGR